MRRALSWFLVLALFVTSCSGTPISPSAVARSSLVPQATDTRSPDPAAFATATLPLARTVTPVGQVQRATFTGPVTLPPSPTSPFPVAVTVQPGALSPGHFCGTGRVNAPQGKKLFATMFRVSQEDDVELGLIPLGERVDVIECALLLDPYSRRWLKVQTADAQIGWVTVEPEGSFDLEVYQGAQGAAPFPFYDPETMVQQEGECKMALHRGTIVESIALDFIPVVGSFKAITEAYTGCDLLTGQPLGAWRWVGLLGFVELGGLLALEQSGQLARRAGAVDELADAARGRKAGVNIDEVVQILEKGGCSFDQGTPVWTSQGLRPIQQIRTGALLLAYDEGTLRSDFYPVVSIAVHAHTARVRLDIDSDIILTTLEHPFYTRELGWIDAGLLWPGAHVRAADGEYGIVRAITKDETQSVMYNLTVGGAHTYFVGRQGWLVHNECPSVILGKNMEDIGAVRAQDTAAHHIIAAADDAAEGARAILRQAGIDINDARNGVFLPRTTRSPPLLDFPNAPAHSALHTKAYYVAVERRLAAIPENARTPANVGRVLQAIGQEILMGRFPF